MAAMEVSAIGIVPDDVAFACFQIGAIADQFDDQLQKRFGGTTMFGQPIAPDGESAKQQQTIGFRPPA